MLVRLYSNVLSGRSRLSEILGLRWFRFGSIGLAVPCAAALIFGASLDQLGRLVGGVPFWICWAVLGAFLAIAGSLVLGRRVRTPAGMLFAFVLALWLLYDFLYLSAGNHLYDLEVYLGSAQRWLDGGSPYLTSALSSWPDGARHDYFLYPPALLPFFGLLAGLPEPLVAAGWTAAMIGCSYAAFRLIGLGRGWSLVLLAFPPVFIGFESGNVASLTFLLFAASMRAGGALVVDTIFKVQAGVPILWLVRERRFRAIATGVAVVATVVLITLPIVGIDAWRQWWLGLGYRAASQLEVPALFGYSYARVIPGPIYVVVVAAFVGLAFAFRGRRGLAAFGLASVFASPALWPHGFAFALPAVLMLESDVAVVAVLGAGALNQNMWLLFIAGWLAVAAARREPAGGFHPMAGTDGPWPRRLLVRRLRRSPAGPAGARGPAAG